MIALKSSRNEGQDMKKYRARYYVAKLDKFYECDVFAMSMKQAFEMYQSQYMTLMELIPCE